MRLLIYLLLFISVFVRANTSDSLFNQANTLYQQKQYNQAIELYQNIINNNEHAWEIYYNLANAYYKTNKNTLAIYYYEKALLLYPNNSDIKNNLTLANLRKTDKIEEMPTPFYIQWKTAIVQLLSMDGWARMSVLTIAITIILGLVFLLTKQIVIKKISFYFGIVMFIFSVASLTIAQHKYMAIKQPTTAIIFNPTVQIKSTPDAAGIDLFILHEGTKVYLIETVNNWYRIRISDGNDGWIEAEKIMKVD